MIGNPCKWFVNGYDEESFTYEGGSTLYHFSPHDSGLSKSMEMNVVFFANDLIHATEVLERMLKFGLERMRDYQEAMGNERFHNMKESKRNSLKNILDGKDQWVIVEAPSHQFYVVGWADNDVL